MAQKLKTADPGTLESPSLQPDLPGTESEGWFQQWERELEEQIDQKVCDILGLNRVPSLN
ncbi:MAG: hypothetical protein GWM98_05175 [Nitrospinaceae bacterium]|nr:hypothetical protein [Nitrospinaceae bacterium]NIS84374.1 hypothetical protein [Nitrospinaceae bacterium]NIT81176.1 hypothetical protein [Nitrospinaceae bacterium]NIU43459.1 hypothetical protein [Nitrospinaceae bacterium]NIU95582.1 hypothetical protein [Nitrospinaceae bacterium]